MNRWFARLLASPVLFGPATSLAIAQEGPFQNPSPRLAALPPQSVVRLRTLDGGRLQGRLLSFDPIAVQLSQQTGTVLVLRRAIESAELRRGTRILRGSLLGGTIGAGAGFAITYLFAPYRSTDFSRSGLAGLVGAMSGLGGIVVGGLFGSTIHTWVRIEP